MENADAESIIKAAFQRQFENVTLHNVYVRHIASQLKSRFNSVAEIDPDDLFCSPLGGKLCVPAFAASAFQNNFAFKKFRLYGLEPTKELVSVSLVLLGKVGP